MNNITLDFTASKSVSNAVANQPVAVMPAGLAKRLLQMYASELASASSRHILSGYRDGIDIHGTIEEAIVGALEFVQERELISNITTGNWDAYKVEEVITN